MDEPEIVRLVVESYGYIGGRIVGFEEFTVKKFVVCEQVATNDVHVRKNTAAYFR